MKAAPLPRKLSCQETFVLRALLYFDLFDHPLLPEEIYCFSQGAFATENEMHQCLWQLRNRGLISYIHPFYLMHPEPERVAARIEGSIIARRRMKTARLMSRIISQFPFVRGVLLSGSLSKGSMKKSGDIDFFIITHPGRLWMVRAMMALAKRIFLFNSHKLFCANYFIDTRHLEIKEKNIFTAVETATLIPTYGLETLEQFLAANKWVKAVFPNAVLPARTAWVPDTNTVGKQLGEILLGGRWLDGVEAWIMEYAKRRLEQKYRAHYDPRSFELAFRSRPGVSKNHPLNFQSAVLQRFQERLRKFESFHNLALAE